MALLKRFEWTILNAAGEPVNGCSVEVRKQGATANASGSLTTIAVHHAGAIVAGDTVVVDATASPTATVNSVAGPAPSQVVVASALSVTNDVSRLSPTNLPTIYNDEDAGENKANPLITDANGYAFCYAPYDFLDALIAGTNAGTAPSGAAKVRLVYDQGGQGDGTSTSSVLDSNGLVTAYVLNTIRTLVNASSKILSIQNGSVEKCSMDLNGRFVTTGGIQTSGSGTVVFGNVGGMQSTQGINVSGGTVTLPSSSITATMLAANAVHPAPSTTTGSSTDVNITTSEVVRLTTSYTPASGNVGVFVTVNLPYLETNPGTGRIESRLYIGGVLKARGTFGTSTGVGENCAGTIAFTWFEPTAASSPTTFEVRDIMVSFNGGTSATYQYSGSSAYPGYMTILEMKK